MADTRISDLSAETTLADADEFVIASSGASQKIDASDVRTYMKDGLTAAEVAIADAGDRYIATDVEGALQEIGFWDRTVRRGSDKDISLSAALENDGVLSFTVTGDVPYRFELVLVYSEPANSGTPDIRHAFALSTGSFSSAWRRHVGLSTANAIQSTAVADMTTTVTNGATSTQRVVVVDGYFVASATATLHFQWAQASSNSNATRVHAASLLRYRSMV